MVHPSVLESIFRQASVGPPIDMLDVFFFTSDQIIILTKMKLKNTIPGCFCAKDCLDSVEMYKWWYTFTCTGGGVL